MNQNEASPRESEEAGLHGFPVWKRTLLILAAASVSLGFALRSVEAKPEPEGSTQQVEPVAVVDSTESGQDVPGAPSLSSNAPDQLSAPLGLQPGGMSELAEFAEPSSFGATAETGERVPVTSGNPAAAPVAAPNVAAGATPSVTEGTTSIPQSQSSTPWSPLFLKGGVSMFVGLCIGHALRAFLKLSMIALGLVFLGVLGLQYSGVLEIDWELASRTYEGMATRVVGELDSLRTFIAGSLPSAGLGSVGLIAGFKRGR